MSLSRAQSQLRSFVTTETSGGIVLLAATVVALVLANSPWQDGYRALFDDDVRHIVNDGLMTLFFFVVGLEIKRELVVGELTQWRTAALPAIAALGGMVVPALLYAAINAGGAGSRGWGIPIATDIAFALGVLALAGDRVPPSLKLFLLTLAIVDDVGAIVVIAVAYSRGLDWRALGAAAALLVLVVVLRRAGVRSVVVSATVGCGVWLAVYESGVHATIAGVALGLLTPADPVAERLERRLHVLTSFAIIPLFALANAGVEISRTALDAPGAGRVAAGVVVGLVVGKVVGITAAVWVAVRVGLCALPTGVRWHHVVGAAAVAGVGFTVSLFITELALPAGPLQHAAKLAILAASVVAAVGGSLILNVRGPAPR